MDNRTLREKLKDIWGPGMSDIKRAGAWLEILTVHVAAQDARLTRVEAATIGTQQPPPRTDVDAEELRLLRLVADVAGRWADDGDHYTELDKAVEALRMYRASRTPLLGFVDALPKGGA